MDITTQFGTVKIKMLKGEQGIQGEQGIRGIRGVRGEPFEFEDFTEEQLATLRADVATVYCKKLEATYNTIGDNTTTIEIPFEDYSSTDMLFVDIEGLTLAEGTDYTISEGSIVLITPITHHYTAVNFRLLRFIAMSTEDFDNLTGDINAKIETDVDAWFVAHPEATTTVLDDSVSDKKLVQRGGVLEEVQNIKTALPQKDETVTRVTADSGATWETGKFYYSGGVGETILQANYASLACAVYGSVKAGEIFNVTAQSIGSGYAIYIVDANNIVLDRFVSPQGTNYYDDVAYTVPADGTMILNTAIASYLNGDKRYKLTQNVETLTPIKSPLDGVKWVSFGDSLNEFNSTAETNWIKYMIAGTNANNVNLAVSGSGFYRYSPLDKYTPNNYITKISSVPSDVEFITVAGSFNDLSSGPWPTLPVGTASDSGSETIAGYMNDFFDTLLAQFPTTPIAVVMTSPWDAYKPGVQRSDDYVAVLSEICQKNGIPFYPDCYYGCNLKPWIAANKTEYYTHPDGSVDGVHPNSSGHVFIYRMLRPFLEKVVHSSD